MMHPLTIVSLWDVIKLDVHHLLASLSYLASTEKYLSMQRRRLIERSSIDGKSYVTPLGVERLVEISVCGKRLNRIAHDLDMPATKGCSARLETELEKAVPHADDLTATHLSGIIREMGNLVSTVHDELEARIMFVVEPGQVRFYSDEMLFGEEVEEAFPSASQEIADAGKCRALERWTACVVHLMRAVEPALNSLAEHLGVQPDQNWNKALNEIDAKLKEINKSTGGAEGEQWASEASAHLRVVKNAWRNHAAHGRARYDKEEAIAIYDNVRPLMRTLARRLSE
jgi:hypothetical protein